MVILGAQGVQTVDVDAMALRVFLKSLELLGGPRRLIEYRNLTWLPSLMAAAYVIVLSEEALKSEDEIAHFLGITRNTVRNIRRADPERVLQRLQSEVSEQASTVKEHTAGGLAKWAYREIKEGRDNLEVFTHFLGQASEIYGIAWPFEVLRHLKGTRFPLTRAALIEQLGNLKIQHRTLKDLAPHLPETFPNPAALLSAIKTALESSAT